MARACQTLLFFLAFLFLQGAELRAVLVMDMPAAAQGSHPGRPERVVAALPGRSGGTGTPLPTAAWSDPAALVLATTMLAAQSNSAPASPAAPAIPGGDTPAAKPVTENVTEPGAGDEDSEGDMEVDLEDDEEDDLESDLEDEFGTTLDSERSDPFSGYNRAMTSFNDGVYVYLFDPVARGYRFAVPEFGRRGIANFFHNLLFPLRFVNNTLQGKFLNAGEEFLRFCINTTIGILGFWDPAEEWFGLEAHDEDFGQTLGVWGVGPGPHVVLPFLGPSNLRDLSGKAPDYYLDPLRYVDPTKDQYALRVYDVINDTSLHIGEYENLRKDAFDLYPFLRDVYEQNRRKKILE